MKRRYTRCSTINGVTRYEDENHQYFVGGNKEVQNLYGTFEDQSEWWGVFPVHRDVTEADIGGIEVDYTICKFRIMTTKEIKETLSLE